MTSLEREILEYIGARCAGVSSPPMRMHISRHFAPRETKHAVNALWSRELIAKVPYGRKRQDRPFVLTQRGRDVLSGEAAA